MAIDPKVFRRGIFNLRTRRFGKVADGWIAFFSPTAAWAEKQLTAKYTKSLMGIGLTR
jgi:hypothetical protein